MKRFGILSLLTAAAITVSCELSEPIRPYENSDDLVAYTGELDDMEWSTFLFTSDEAEAKTVYSGNTILWSAGDKIRMAYTVDDDWQGANGNPMLYESDALSSGGATASFSVPGQFPSSGSGTYEFHTIYPSSAVEDNDFSNAPIAVLTIPEEQTPPAASFDPAADLMIGHSAGTYQSKPTGAIPLMWNRKVAHGEITLKKLSDITGFSTSETIQSVTLTAQDGVYMTGLFLYDFSSAELVEEEAVNSVTIAGDNLSWGTTDDKTSLTFWISICPVEVTSLTITLETDAATYTKTYSGISRTFNCNAHNTLNIGMSKATRTAKKQYYEKVTSAPSDWSGAYLIVYEGGNVAFNGGLSTLDAVSNTIGVTIYDGKIEKTATTEAAQFTIAPITGGYSIKSASGKYIGNDSNSNSLTSSNNALVNTLSCSSGSVNVISSGGAYLRYNSQSGQTRFRYFKSSSYSSQQAIQLYKLGNSSGGGETPPDPQPATATVTTAEEITCTQTTAELSGSYTGATGEISEVGFYWGESSTPSTKVVSDRTSSPFTYSLTGLTANKTYYFQAYVIESGEEIKGNVESFTTEAEQQSSGGDYVLVTASQSDWSGAYVLGHLSSMRILNGITASGTKYGTYTTVSISNNTIAYNDGKDYEVTIEADSGHYTLYLKNVGYLGWSSGNTLISNSTVLSNNYRWDISYSGSTLTISNAQSTSRYLQYNSGSPRFACYDGGGQQPPSLFKRGTSTPQVTVTTGSASSIGQDSATLNGSFTAATGLTATKAGFYFGTSESSLARLSDSEINNPAASFSLSMIELNAGTTYYFKAYVIESDGSATAERVGGIKYFTTKSIPTATATVTASVTNIVTTTATLNGTYSGETGEISEVGFYWGTSSNPGTKVVRTATNNAFSYNLSGLTVGTTYYYRAYVKEYNESTEQVEERSTAVAQFTAGRSNPDWAELPSLDYTQHLARTVNNVNYYYYTDNSTHGNKYASGTLYYTHHWTNTADETYTGTDTKYVRNYTCCWSSAKKCPVWVAAPRHSWYETGTAPNRNYAFNPDMPQSVQYNSTSGSGTYNRGHMLGAAERKRTSYMFQQVNYITNISPQHGTYFNASKGGWNILEDWVDKQVCSDTLYVVIGCLFDDFTDGYGNHASPSTITFMGTSNVACPTAFYYALLRTKSGSSGKSVKNCTSSELKCAAFIRAQASGIYEQAVTATEMNSIAELEALTGFTFFSNVPNAPKSTFKASDWGL